MTAEPAVRQRRRRRKVLTDTMIPKLQRRAAAYFFPDPELVKFGVRIRPTGPGAYTVITRDPYKRQRWVRIGSADAMKIAEAREIARAVIRRIEAGETPFPPVPKKPDSVEAACRKWLKRHVGLDLDAQAVDDDNEGDKEGKLRTAHEIRRIIKKYVLPHWAEKSFFDIKRSDIAALLDHIEDKHGAAVADGTLTVLRSVAGWHVKHGWADNSYINPFREIARRVPEAKRKRDRMLDDDELRRVWHAAGDAGAYGGFLKLLLISAQRFDKVAKIRWKDVSPDGVWTIATEEGEKGNAGQLKLPRVAIEIIEAQPKFAANDFVFGANTSGFNSRLKRQFDEACGVHNWRHHDLRRTAKSLMAKAGVLREHSERVLGHSLGPIDDIYNQYAYDSEKASALARLAALISIILAGKPTNDIAKLQKQIDAMVKPRKTKRKAKRKPERNKPSNVVPLHAPAAAS